MSKPAGLKPTSSDSAGRLIAVVFEDAHGWNLTTAEMIEDAGQLVKFTERVKQDLSHYVNRKGIDPPLGLTRVGLAMWLMAKEDGTTMGRPSG